MPREVVLLTGASGFVGGHLCGHLRKCGYAVITAGRSVSDLGQVEHRQWDLTMPVPDGLLDGIGIVMHLAGRAHALADSVSQAALYDRVNHRASVELLEASNKSQVGSFFFMSSSKAAPAGSGGGLSDPYSASKWRAEKALLERRDELSVAIARPALVYGPGCKGNLLRLMRAIDRGRLPPMPKVQNRRSLIGVDDLCRAVVQMVRDPMPRDDARPVALTDGELYSTLRIVNALSSALGRGAVQETRVPLSLYRAAGRLGDLAQFLSGRQLPLSLDATDKMFGSTELAGDDLLEKYRTGIRDTLETAAPAMAAFYRRNQSVGTAPSKAADRAGRSEP